MTKPLPKPTNSSCEHSTMGKTVPIQLAICTSCGLNKKCIMMSWLLDTVRKKFEQTEVLLSIDKLIRLSKDMRDEKNYLPQPQRDEKTVMLKDTKMQEWISRLGMVVNTLREVGE